MHPASEGCVLWSVCVRNSGPWARLLQTPLCRKLQFGFRFAKGLWWGPWTAAQSYLKAVQPLREEKSLHEKNPGWLWVSDLLREVTSDALWGLCCSAPSEVSWREGRQQSDKAVPEVIMHWNFYSNFLIPFWSYQLESLLFIILLFLWVWDAVGWFNIHLNCTTYAHLYVVWQFCLGSYGNWEHPVILVFGASSQWNLYLWHNGESILSKGLLYRKSKWLVKLKVPGLTKRLLKRHLPGRLTCI